MHLYSKNSQLRSAFSRPQAFGNYAHLRACGAASRWLRGLGHCAPDRPCLHANALLRGRFLQRPSFGGLVGAPTGLWPSPSALGTATRAGMQLSHVAQP